MLGRNSIAFFAYTRHTPDPLHTAVAHWLVTHGFELSIPDAIDYSSVLRLENMMRDSDCFVAIESSIGKDDVNSDISGLLFQNDLASRANKPTLLLADHLLERQLRSSLSRLGQKVVLFDRKQGHDNSLMIDLARAMAAIQDRIQPRVILPPRDDVGLLVDSTRDIRNVYSDSVMSTISRLFAAQAYMVKVVKLGPTLDAGFYDFITNCAFVVIEGRSSLFSPQIAEGISARCVPILRLCHIKDDESIETVSYRELSPAAAGYVLEINGRKIRPVIFWEHEVQLECALSEMLTAMEVRRAATLRTFADVTAHFSRPESILQFRVTRTASAPPKVFLSNSGTTGKPLINEITTRLRLERIEFFHYERQDAIPLGDNWQGTLDAQVRQCSIFVAVINHDYFASNWCLSEMKLALDLSDRDKIKIFAYYLDMDWSASDSDIQTKLGGIQHRVVCSTSHDEIADDIIRNYKRVSEIHY